MIQAMKNMLLGRRLQWIRRAIGYPLKKLGAYDDVYSYMTKKPRATPFARLENLIRQAQAEQKQSAHEILNALYRIHPVEIAHNLEVITARPVADDSLDHTQPSGTIQDNTCKPRFVLACEKYMGRKHSYLDLGCSGGGLVRNFLEKGNFSLGIEGSNHSYLEGRAEWARIPKHLFTADITSEYVVRDKDTKVPHAFDIIGAWEVMEHLPESTLPQFCTNIVRHLAPTGIFVASVAMFPLPHHICLHEESWWVEMFARNGLERIDHSQFFTLADFPRGGPADWPPGGGFHIVCRRKG